MTKFHISTSLNLIVQSFQYSKLSDPVLELLTGVAQTSQGYFAEWNPADIQGIVLSRQVTEWTSCLQQGDFVDAAMKVPEFLLALVEREDLSSANYVANHTLDNVFAILQKLLACQGAARGEAGRDCSV